MDDKKQENNKTAKNAENLNENAQNEDENFLLQNTQANDNNLTASTKAQREKRKSAPKNDLQLVLEHPQQSPSTTCSADTDEQTTDEEDFEPTIDMLVNDFDDEQTLNEEEEIAAQEMLDPQQEIDTLKQESEMPLEKLLAMYAPLAEYCAPEPLPVPVQRKKIKKSSALSKKVKFKAEPQISSMSETTTTAATTTTTKSTAEDSVGNNDVDVGATSAEQAAQAQELLEPNVLECDGASAGNEENMNETHFIKPVENRKQRRTHLIELYPEENFATVASGDESRDDEEEDEAEDDETDYAKKAVMVGPAYQAVIPVGLSQYGDILPYENEDKLVWEPSQVSEQEVEEYLLAAENKNSTDADGTATSGVVKDDEQALHLLVQCGYDFKEALRRKQLNAMPLSGTMSIWSEEECQKFEEGIQKYGKDFLKIRQNLVKTRTMRELVHFYYLWKKSHRRDQSFPNSDTIDQMDVFLNESGDYNTNNMPIIPTSSANHQLNATMSKNATSLPTQQKQFSIMTGNYVAADNINAAASAITATINGNINTTVKSNSKKRSISTSATTGGVGLNTQNIHDDN